jgi:transketolase
MRKQFVTTVERVLNVNPNVVLLLGDIGVFGFRNAFRDYPNRVYNIGILEQATVGVAAGLAKTELIPIVHTIAPFLIERCLEQLKIDFGYQQLGGNFISVGNSYDYASLGCTHHCPADIGLLKNIPNFEIIVPGTAAEFDSLFQQTYADKKPTYFRLSERQNSTNFDVSFGKANLVKSGTDATIIAVGTALQAVYDAVKDMDVTLLYYSTVTPFDAETLQKNITSSRKVILCEPYYEGALASDICKSLKSKPFTLDFIGVPLSFINHYGKMQEIDEYLKLTPTHIKQKIEKIIYV